MENIVFTQLSAQEVRSMIREELRNVIREHIPQIKPRNEMELMTIEELSQFINMVVLSIYGLVHQRKIPFIKRGKRLIFEKQKIIEWLQSGRRKTQSEIIAEANDYMIKKKEK